MNLKHIATTIALLGSGALVLTACNKEKGSTEVPGGEGGEAGEAQCAADDHPAEGHCGGDSADGADAAEGDAEEAGEEVEEAADEAEAAADEPE
jgi:hypothetical protein